MPTLSAHDVARELGRSRDWLYANWRAMVKQQGMPRPLHGGGRGGELTWSSIHFHLWLDRDLPNGLRDQAMAIRAAIAAIRASPLRHSEADKITQWKQKLDERLGT